MNRVCRECKENKPITDFARNSMSTDGHIWICKPCYHKVYGERIKIANRNYRIKLRPILQKKTATSVRRRRKLNLEKYRKAGRERYKRDYHISKTATKVRWAIENGKLIKPRYCSCCGCERKIQAHHEDYSKPYNVIWLCSSCHGFLHAYKKNYKK